MENEPDTEKCICDERRDNAKHSRYTLPSCCFYWTCPAHGLSGLDFRNISVSENRHLSIRSQQKIPNLPARPQVPRG